MGGDLCAEGGEFDSLNMYLFVCKNHLDATENRNCRGRTMKSFEIKLKFETLLI